MLANNTIEKINKCISEESDIEKAAQKVKEVLNEEEIMQLKARLMLDVFDIDAYIRDIIELLNAEGIRTLSSHSGVDGGKEGGHILIKAGNNDSILKALSEKSKIEWKILNAHDEEKAYLIKVSGADKEKTWDNLHKELNNYFED
jgi:hypothetical protein